MEKFEDKALGNLVVGINYLELKKDFDIAKEAMRRIYDRIDNAALKTLQFRPERRKDDRRSKNGQ